MEAPQPALQVERPLLNSEATVAAIGSEAGAREVVRLVLGSLFRQRSSGRHFVLASQVREACLPEIKVIEITRLTDAEVQRHLATLGLRYFGGASDSEASSRLGGGGSSAVPARFWCVSIPRTPEKLGNKGSSRSDGRLVQRLNVHPDARATFKTA